MTSSITKARGVAAWETSDSRIHALEDLRNLLSRFTKETDELSEVALEGDQPVIIQRTETNDMIIEISAAYKSGTGNLGGPSGLIEESRDSGIEELKELFDEVESPAITTQEVANKLGWQKSETLKKLTELEHRGQIAYRKSGDSWLWWQVDDNTDDGLEAFPDFIQKGLEQSKGDIDEWLEVNKREDESLEETHNRIRGNPTPEEFERILKKGSAPENNLMEHIKSKRKSEKNRKGELQDLF